MRFLFFIIFMALGNVAHGSCGAIAELEAQLEEMRSMDVPDETLKPMVEQLENMKADNPECQGMGAAERDRQRREFNQDVQDAQRDIEADHDIRRDYFEQTGQTEYADCDQYQSMQTLSLCAAAAEQYSAYWEAAASGDTSRSDLEKMYKVHAKSAKNLIRLVDNL